MVTVSPNELDTAFKYEVAAQPGGENIKRCFACGACSGGCLIGEVADAQFDPRKIIRMVSYGMKDQVLSSSSIWLCLLCGNCNFHCIQDVKFDEVMGALRHLAVKEGYVHPSFLRKLAFHTLLPSHTKLELLTRPLSFYSLLRMPVLLRTSRALHVLPERLRDYESMLPHVPTLPLSQRVNTVTRARGKTKMRVAFFLNCADDLVFAPTGLATVSLLAENECEVVTPKGVQCCGMPCFGYGEMEEARKLARHNIDVFEHHPTEAIITDCATCGSFLKGYGNLLKDDEEYAGKAAAFSRKVKDISEFLVETIDKDPQFAGQTGKVTYHDPCHLVWAQDVTEQPRRLLQSVPGLELIEMKNSNTCCGGAGSYNLTHYETSMSILDKKTASISATGAGTVATGCPGCRLQIGLGMKRKGMPVKVAHPVDLLKTKRKTQSGK